MYSTPPPPHPPTNQLALQNGLRRWKLLQMPKGFYQCYSSIQRGSPTKLTHFLWIRHCYLHIKGVPFLFSFFILYNKRQVTRKSASSSTGTRDRKWVCRLIGITNRIWVIKLNMILLSRYENLNTVTETLWGLFLNSSRERNRDCMRRNNAILVNYDKSFFSVTPQ